MQNNEITYFKAVYKNKLKITKSLNVRLDAIKNSRGKCRQNIILHKLYHYVLDLLKEIKA